MKPAPPARPPPSRGERSATAAPSRATTRPPSTACSPWCRSTWPATTCCRYRRCRASSPSRCRCPRKEGSISPCWSVATAPATSSTKPTGAPPAQASPRLRPARRRLPAAHHLAHRRRRRSLASRQPPAERIADAVWWSQAPRKVMRDFLGAAQAIVVTEDSLSMVAESLYSGPAGASGRARRRPTQRQRRRRAAGLRRTRPAGFAARSPGWPRRPFPSRTAPIPDVQAEIADIVLALLEPKAP